jgi:hypothetical protein
LNLIVRSGLERSVVYLHLWGVRPISNHVHGQIFAGRFVKGIISLGDVERQIPFIHAGPERKFPVNPLFPGQDCILWAEFGDSGSN